MIFRTKDGKYIGQLRGSQFFKTVRMSQHMLQEPPGWAIDSDVVDTLKLTGTCKTIRIYEQEQRFVWQVTLDKFVEKSFEIDRGYGKQRVLALPYWKCKPMIKGSRFKQYSPVVYANGTHEKE